MLGRLIGDADVVIDNFKLGTMEGWGFDDTWFETNAPRAVRCSITGYGSTGPKAGKPGYDFILQAETGLMAITGESEGSPMKLGVAIVDICTGIYGAVAVLAALQARERTGKGQRVETSLLNVGVSLMTYHLVYYLLTGEVAPRLGNGHLGNVPHGIYRARDGRYVAVSTCWPRIARVVGEEWLTDDPRFKDGDARVAHREELDEILRQAFLKLDADDWLELLRMADIAAAPVNTADRVVEHPQVQHQQMVFHLDHPKGGAVGLVDVPIRFGNGPATASYTPPPILGQDTGEVLTQLLGYSAEKLAALRQQQEAHAAELEEHTIKKR